MNQETNPIGKSVLVSKYHDITSFASTDSNRLAIQGVHYNASKKCVEATDGTMAVRVPVLDQAEEFVATAGDTAELTDKIIPPTTWKKGIANIPKGMNLPVLSYAKLSSKGEKATLTTNDLDNEQALTAKGIDCQYPNLDQVWPSESTTLSIRLCAEKLRKIADYADKHGTPDKTGCVCITFQFVDESKAVQWAVNIEGAIQEKTKATGLLMPVRLV